MEMERTTITRLRVSSFIREFGGWEGAAVEGGGGSREEEDGRMISTPEHGSIITLGFHLTSKGEGKNPLPVVE